MLLRLLAGSLHLLPAGPQGHEALALTREQEAVFAVIDKFDSLDTSRMPFVKVATGQSMKYGDEPWQNSYRHGFLVHSDGKQFRIRYLDWGKELLRNTPAGTEEHERVGFEPVDLAEFAAATAARLQASHGDPNVWRFHRSPETPWCPESFVLLLMRACARRGHVREVNLLWESLPVAFRGVQGLQAARGFADDLQEHLALEFGDRSLSWQDLLARHETWLATFRGEGRADVTERREQLVDMLAKDLARAGNPAAAGDALAEAIRDLRNEFLPINANWDTFYISLFEQLPEGTVRPMDRVAAFGLQAVPALIDAMEDQSLTRSVCYASRKSGRFFVRPLGELAGEALREIAGDARCYEPKRDWQEWFARASRDGVRKCLAEAMADQHRSYEATRSYLQRWPDDLDAVIDVARKSQRRGSFLDLLVRSAPHAKDPRIVRLLEEEAGRGDEHERIDAARNLLRWGSRSGAAMLFQGCRDSFPPTSPVLGLLLESGLPEAWQALQRTIELPATRAALAGVLKATTVADLLAHVDEQDRARVRQLLKDCLLRLLSDDTACGEQVVLAAGRQRVCVHVVSHADVAAWLLAANWSDEFRFDAAQTSSMRRAQIAAMLRAIADGDRRVAADRPVVLRPPEPELAALVGRFEQRQGWERDLQALRDGGAGALPTLEALLKALPEEHPARIPLTEAAAKVANTVRAVIFAPSAEALPAELQDKVRSLQKAPPDARQLLETLIAIAGAEASKGKIAVLDLERAGTGDGATITCSLLTGDGESRGAHYQLRATAGGEEVAVDGVLMSQGGLDDLADFGSYACLPKIDRALGVRSTTGLELRLKLHRH